METLLIVTIIGLVLLVAFAVYFLRKHSRFSGSVRGPGNTSAKIRAEGRAGDASVKDAESREGSITARSTSGGNATVESSRSQGDITAESGNPPSRPDE